MSISFGSRFRTFLHVAHLTSWKSSRFALVLWGLLNGFGLGLLSQV